jgi:hypothetical protein
MNEKNKSTARLLRQEDELQAHLQDFGYQSQTENTFNEVSKGGEQD